MIDLDELQAAINRCAFDGDVLGLSKAECSDLLGRLRQAEKDAARYRWLRESASTENHGGLAYNFRLVDAIRYMPGATPNETMDIDAAIDEAMQCK